MSFFYSSRPGARGSYRSTKESGNSFAPTLLNTYLKKIANNGGTLAVDTEAIASDFLDNVALFSGAAKIIYMLPMLGGNLAAALVPIIDTLGVGPATNHSFTSGDFGQASGLQGNGSTKYLDTGVKPSQLATGQNGGLGYRELNFVGSGNSEVIGCYGDGGSSRFCLDLRTSRYFFSWGNPGFVANKNVTSANKHYYGNRASSIDRRLYENGVLEDTNTSSEAAAGTSDETIILVGCNEFGTIVPSPSLCGYAYLTSGDFSDAEAAAWHTLCETYLITATGK